MVTDSHQRQTTRPLVTLLGALLLFVVCEASIFRSGLYDSYLEPDSNAGRFEYTLLAERQRQPSGKMEFLVLGDSRVSEGLSEKLSDRYLDGQPYKLVNRSVPGTTPRVWHYQLREIDPDRRRYQGIVLCVSHYADYDYGTDHFYTNAINDYRYLITRLTYGDIPEFAGSFEKAALKKEAALALLFKGFALKHDLWEFLKAPGKRRERRALYDANSAQWQYDYEGRSGSFTGLAFDPASQTIVFPAEIGEAERQATNDHLNRHLGPATGAMATFNRKWLGKIVDRYRGSSVQLFFVALPRHPVFPLYPQQTEVGSVLRELARQDHVNLLEEDAFSFINKQENFSDFMHLNKEGRKIFTKTLSTRIAHFQAGEMPREQSGIEKLSEGVRQDAL